MLNQLKNTILLGALLFLTFPQSNAAPVTKTVTISTGTPVKIAEIAGGDTITISVYLTSPDGNEDGEGEPLVVTKNGLPLDRVGKYYEEYNIFDDALANPVVNTNTEYYAYIDGYDGDEVATLEITTNSLLERLYPTPEKRKLFELSTRFGAVAGLTLEWMMTDCPLTTVTAPECVALMGAATATSGAASYILNRLAHDPPDANYTQISQPVFYTLPQSTGQYFSSQFNSLLRNDAAIISYGRAAYTAMNRAQGALEAGDEKWRVSQIQAMSGFMEQMTTALNNSVTLRRQLRDTLIANGAVQKTYSALNALSMEQAINAQGLPASVTSNLTLLGLSSDQIDGIRKMLSVQDINQLASTFPASVFSSDLALAAQDWSSNHSLVAVAEALPPTIKLSSPAVVPVRLLAGPNFNARTKVNLSSLHFGRTGTENSLRNCHIASAADIPGNGPYPSQDVVCLFSIQDAAFLKQSNQGILTGRTVDGRPLRAVTKITPTTP